MAAYRRVYDSHTCRLTAKNRDQLRNPMLGNRVRATVTIFTYIASRLVPSACCSDNRSNRNLVLVPFELGTRRRGCYPHWGLVVMKVTTEDSYYVFDPAAGFGSTHGKETSHVSTDLQWLVECY